MLERDRVFPLSTGAKRTSTSVAGAGGGLDKRSENTRRTPGSHTSTRPHSIPSPVAGSCTSMKRPPTPGSNRTPTAFGSLKLFGPLVPGVDVRGEDLEGGDGVDGDVDAGGDPSRSLRRGSAPRAFGVGLERSQLLGPERLHLVEPGLESDKAFGAQASTRGAGRRRRPAPPRPARSPRARLQVTAHRRCAHLDRGRQLARPERAGAEQVDHLPPGGIGQRGEGGVEVGIEIVLIFTSE